MSSPSHRHDYQQDVSWPGPPPSRNEQRSGALGYLGGIVTGPVLPLIVYLARRHTSEFARSHAAQALNITLTVALYAISGTIVGVLLSFDSATAALAVMLPIAAVVWVTMVVYLVRGAAAAVHGEFREIPAWICASLVS